MVPNSKSRTGTAEGSCRSSPPRPASAAPVDGASRTGGGPSRSATAPLVVELFQVVADPWRCSTRRRRCSFRLRRCSFRPLSEAPFGQLLCKFRYSKWSLQSLGAMAAHANCRRTCRVARRGYQSHLVCQPWTPWCQCGRLYGEGRWAEAWAAQGCLP
jgi:hypothetical protein